MPWLHTHSGNEGEDLEQGGAEELRLLAGVLHADHVQELQRLHGRVAEVLDEGELLGRLPLAGVHVHHPGHGLLQAHGDLGQDRLHLLGDLQ